MEFMIAAFDPFEIDPNGQSRIFGIGTRVRVPTGQIGTVVKINRATLTVRLPSIKATRSYQPHLLEIIQ